MVTVTDYTIAGHRLRVETHGAEVTGWVRSFLEGFHLRSDNAWSSEDNVITLQIVRDELPQVPQTPEMFAINHGMCATDGIRYFLNVDESLVVIEAPQERLVRVWFGRSQHARHPIALVNVFSYAFQAALRRAGVYDLHAAGVCLPGSSRGALFVGESGSGKSTLTIRFLESGWNYLSDDMVALIKIPEGIIAHSLRRLFALSGTSVAGGGLTRLLGSPVNSDPTKRRLDPEIAFPGRRSAECRPQTLFFIGIVDTDRSIVEPISTQLAMQHLVRFCPWATYDKHSAPDYLRLLAGLASQCMSFSVQCGRDLLDHPSRTADLLTPYIQN